MKALILNSSAQGDASVSNKLTKDLVERLRAADPECQIKVRDIGSNPIPHLTATTVQGIRGVAESDAEREAQALSDSLIEELREADLIVIGAPMYNFGMPSTLKAWFDHVLRARVTFRYTENGPEGLLTGKRAVVIETRAGIYSEGPASGLDSQEPHIRTLLGFMGITDVHFVRVEGLAYGEEAATRALDAAVAELDEVARQPLPLAA
jgi:FMN-dependent NADH-azoreductase